MHRHKRFWDRSGGSLAVGVSALRRRAEPERLRGGAPGTRAARLCV